MRLKDDAMAPITPEEIHDLFTALEFTRKDVARVCGLSEFAPGRWRQSGRIPLIHLGHLSDALRAKLKDRKDLSPVEIRAKHYLFRHVDIHQATGSSIPLDAKSPFYDAAHPLVMNLKLADPFSAEIKVDQISQLSTVSLEELLHEIGRRGFKVQIEPKE